MTPGWCLAFVSSSLPVFLSLIPSTFFCTSASFPVFSINIPALFISSPAAPPSFSAVFAISAWGGSSKPFFAPLFHQELVSIQRLFYIATHHMSFDMTISSSTSGSNTVRHLLARSLGITDFLCRLIKTVQFGALWDGPQNIAWSGASCFFHIKSKPVQDGVSSHIRRRLVNSSRHESRGSLAREPCSEERDPVLAPVHSNTTQLPEVKTSCQRGETCNPCSAVEKKGLLSSSNNAAFNIVLKHALTDCFLALGAAETMTLTYVLSCSPVYIKMYRISLLVMMNLCSFSQLYINCQFNVSLHDRQLPCLSPSNSP